MVSLVVRAVTAMVPAIAVTVGLLPAPALALSRPARSALSASSGPNRCTPLTIDMSTPLNPIAMAYAPDQFAVRPAAVHNGTGFDFDDLYFEFLIGPGGGGPLTGAAPQVRWNIDGGGWQYLALYPQGGHWDINYVRLPAVVTAGSSHTIQVGVAFHADNPAVSYYTQLNLGAMSCGNYMLGSDTSMEYSYYLGPGGPTGPNGTGARTAAPRTGSTASAVTPTNRAAAVTASSAPAPTSTPAPEPTSAPMSIPAATSTSTSMPTLTPTRALTALPAAHTSPLWPTGVALLAVLLTGVAGTWIWRRRRGSADGRG